MNTTVDALIRATETDDQAALAALREQSLADPDTFWQELAALLSFDQPFDTVSTPGDGARRWFVGGTVNYHETLFGAHKDPDAELLVIYEADGRRVAYTRTQLRAAVESVGAFLIDQGVVAGSVVALCVENRHLAALYSLACLGIGARFGFIYFRFPNETVADQVALINADTFIYEHAVREQDAAPDLSAVASLARVLTVDGATVPTPATAVTTPALLPEVAYDSKSFRAHAHDAEAPAYYFFTSGTTATPKAVPAGTAGMSLAAIADYYQLQHAEGAVNFFSLDFAWGSPLAMLFLSPLMVGTRVVLDRRFFKPGLPHTFEVFAAEGVTVTAIPNVMFEKELPTDRQYHLRRLVMGGMSLSERALKNSRTILDPSELSIHFGYGSSEVGGITFVGRGAPDCSLEAITTLHPICGVAYTTFPNDAGCDVLCVANNFPGICASIIGDADGYRSLFREDDQWFCTHDVVSDLGDAIRLEGRADAMVKVKGRFLDATALSDVIYNTLGCASTLLDIPTADGVQQLILFLETEPEPALEDRVRAVVTEHFGAYAQPAQVIALPEFPRTAAGKIRTGALREQVSTVG